MSDVGKWFVNDDGIFDADGNEVAYWYEKYRGDHRVEISDEARRQIEALPLLVAAVECRGALEDYIEGRIDTISEAEAVAAKYGMDSSQSLREFVESVEAQALAALRGDDAAEGV